MFTAFVILVRFFVGTGCDEAEREIGIGGTIGCLRLTTIVVVNNGHKNKIETFNGSGATIFCHTPYLCLFT